MSDDIKITITDAFLDDMSQLITKYREMGLSCAATIGALDLLREALKTRWVLAALRNSDAKKDAPE